MFSRYKNGLTLLDCMRKIWKFIKNLLFWTFFISLFIITLSTVLLKIFEDDIEQYAINELNKHINTQVDVEDISMSILKSFPYASINFHKVFIKDSYENIKSDDTLFYAKDLYFNFNVLDIISENYSVKDIQTQNAILKIKTSADGDVNYNITKPSEDTTETNFKFEVEMLKIANLRFEYSNVATKQFYKLDLNYAEINGNFSEKEYNLTATSNLKVNRLKSNSFALLKNKNATLNLNLHIDTEKNRYTFNKGDLMVEKMPFSILGFITSDSIDLNISGKNINLDDLSKTILNESIEQSKSYEGKGLVQFETTIKGSLEKTEMPDVVANFSIENGSVREKNKNMSVQNINLIGSYCNAYKNRKEALNFTELSFHLLKSNFNGNCKIHDFVTPTFTGKMRGNLDLNAFHQFFSFSSIQNIAGNIQFNTDFSIQFIDIEYNPEKFEFKHIKGDLSIEKGSVLIKGDNLTYHNIHGDIIINKKDAAIKNFQINTNKTDFTLNGAIVNFIPFIEGKEGLGLVASVESNQFYLDEFLGDNKQNANQTQSQTMVEIPNLIHLNLDLKIKKLVWDTHTFEDIQSKMLMSNRKINIPKFSLKTLGGNIYGNLTIQNLLENGNKINGEFNFSNIDVKTLFQEWKNFDQQSILSENINGKAKGKMTLFLPFDPYFNILEKNMVVESNIEISQGELINLALMKDITGYMRTNKALKLALNKHIDNFEKKLLHIKFSNLKNDILIKDGRIIIPKMLIQSSALDIEFSGWHDFENNIEYHFSFRFRELKTKPEYTEFGKIEDDGLGWRIFLTMTGNIDDPIYSLDKGEMKATFKENVETEKSTAKSILKTEFGLFKKDSTVKTIQDKKTKEVEFIFYESEEELNPKDTTHKSKNKGKTNQFFEKLKNDLKKEKETQIEIDK